MYILIIIANILVGISIGISGIAGFLLPMFYTGVLFLATPESMAMSFSAFAISGIIGAYSYNKTKDIDFKFCSNLAVGAIIGSIIGVWFNGAIPVIIAKRVLYAMVFVSGFSIMIPKKDGKENQLSIKIKTNPLLIILLGMFIATISSFTGAGGPVLSVPLLSLLGFSVRQAVGMSLFNSIFIAVPAIAGYYNNTTDSNIIILIAVAVTAHAIGIMFGAKISDKINQNILKIIIATISISVSIYMIYTTF